MINIDDSYKVLDNNTRGRKEKIWFIKDDKKYLFKYGASNYEIYAELIAEQLGLECNIDMAHYNLAKYKNIVGVITPSFIKTGELIISSDKLKNAVKSVYEENNLEDNLSTNTVSNLVEAMFTLDSNIDTEKTSYELMKRWVFYGLIMESDKNDTNIGVIKDNTSLRLSPDYDNSTMARLNEDINDFIEEIRHNNGIYDLTDDIQTSFHITDKDDNRFLVAYNDFITKYPTQSIRIMSELSNIDIDEAIKKVEILNNTTIPWIVKYWVTKSVSTRLLDMQNIIRKKAKI